MRLSDGDQRENDRAWSLASKHGHDRLLGDDDSRWKWNTHNVAPPTMWQPDQKQTHVLSRLLRRATLSTPLCQWRGQNSLTTVLWFVSWLVTIRLWRLKKSQTSINKNNNKQDDDSDGSKTWTSFGKGDNSLTGTADDTVRRGKSVAVVCHKREQAYRLNFVTPTIDVCGFFFFFSYVKIQGFRKLVFTEKGAFFCASSKASFHKNPRLKLNSSAKEAQTDKVSSRRHRFTSIMCLALSVIWMVTAVAVWETRLVCPESARR